MTLPVTPYKLSFYVLHHNCFDIFTVFELSIWLAIQGCSHSLSTLVSQAGDITVLSPGDDSDLQPDLIMLSRT